MVWALARHPQWQDAAREEIAGIDADRLDYAEMDRAPVVERIFKEALRLRPPVPFIPRYALRPFAIGGYEIPGDTHIALIPGMVARDPALWSDPLAFDPDRFLPERAEDRSHRFAWSPFGGGRPQVPGPAFRDASGAGVHLPVSAAVPGLPGVRARAALAHAPRPSPADGLPVLLEPAA